MSKIERTRAATKRWQNRNRSLVRESNRIREQNRRKLAGAPKRLVFISDSERVQHRERYQAAWRAINTARLRAYVSRHRAEKLRATPAWLTTADYEAMLAVYAEAARLTIERGEPYHVDHIVPLRGRKVCGLHVPANLTALRGLDNQRKNNRFDDTSFQPLAKTQAGGNFLTVQLQGHESNVTPSFK